MYHFQSAPRGVREAGANLTIYGAAFPLPARSWLLGSAPFAPSMAVAAFWSAPGLPQVSPFLIAIPAFHYSQCFLLLAPSGVWVWYL